MCSRRHSAVFVEFRNSLFIVIVDSSTYYCISSSDVLLSVLGSSSNGMTTLLDMLS